MRSILSGIIAACAVTLSPTLASAQSCSAEAGNDQAQVYVDQCLQVSPATHPPCNADNPCDMIISEIVRGCDMLGGDAPDFCSDYSD